MYKIKQSQKSFQNPGGTEIWYNDMQNIELSRINHCSNADFKDKLRHKATLRESKNSG